MDGSDSESEQRRKLFVGGLPPNLTEDEMREYFSQYGELMDVVVMKDKTTGRSRGFGFVTYKNEDSVDQVQENRPHTLDNKEVETRRAMPRSESARDEGHLRVSKLFVGGLKPETTEEELRDHFGQFGTVTAAEIAMSRETGKPRGFAFVTFTDVDAVDKAILHKPHNIGQSQNVDCKPGLSREQIAEQKARQMQVQTGGFMGGRGGFVGGGRGGYGGGYGGGGYGGGGYGGGGYGGGYYEGNGGYDGYSRRGGGDGMYENGRGFGSYGGQGYGGGPSKGPSGFGGGPQRFQPYGGGPMGGRGGRGAPRGMGGGGFRGSRGGPGYAY